MGVLFWCPNCCYYRQFEFDLFCWLVKSWSSNRIWLSFWSKCHCREEGSTAAWSQPWEQCWTSLINWSTFPSSFCNFVWSWRMAFNVRLPRWNMAPGSDFMDNFSSRPHRKSWISFPSSISQDDELGIQVPSAQSLISTYMPKPLNYCKYVFIHDTAKLKRTWKHFIEVSSRTSKTSNVLYYTYENVDLKTAFWAGWTWTLQ